MPVPPKPAPSPLGRAGRLLEVRKGSRSAVVTEQGAGLFQVNWDGTDLLGTTDGDGFGGHGTHGQILVPWPGRVALGSYTYENESYQLPVDDQKNNAAIHGFARWITWQPKHERDGALTMAARMLARTGYPFCFDLEQSYAWSDDGLHVSFSATNIGESTAPFGYGCHPYFTVGLPRVDEGILRVPAEEYFEADAALNPLGPPRPLGGTAVDYREPRPVGATQLDVTFAALQRDTNGNTDVTFASPDGGVSVTCTFGPDVNYVQVYSGDTLAAADQRRALAIEPYTCTPNAFNNGLGLLRIPPGGTMQVDWAISASVR